MMLVGWAIVGVIIGAAGSELLRAKMPRLVRKVEDAAKEFVDSFSRKEEPDEKKAVQKLADDDPFA